MPKSVTQNFTNFLNHYLWFSGFLFLFSLGQLQRIQLTTSIAIYAHEIYAIVWMIKEFSKYFSWLKRQFFNTIFFREHSSIVYFTFYILLQLVFYNTLNFQLSQIVYYLRFAFYVTLLVFLYFQNQSKKLSPLNFQLAISYIGIFTAVMGLIQYFTIPDSRFLIYSGWDDHYYRLISTFFDPGFTALILVLTFLALFSWQHNSTKFFSYLISPLFLLTILLTYSRAGYVSLLAALLLFLFIQLRQKATQWKFVTSTVFMVSFVVLIPLLPKPGGEGVNLLRTASIEQRIESNHNAINTLNWQTIVFGSGFYRSILVKDAVPNHATAPDNSFVFVFISLGIFGSILLLLTMNQYKHYFFHRRTLLLTFCALCVNSVFNNSLFYVWNWVVMGMIVMGEERRK